MVHHKACHTSRLFIQEARRNHFTEPRHVEGGDPLAFVVSLNLKRRHLSESQRGMVAAEIETLEYGGDRKNQDANLHGERTKAVDMLNVSTRTVASAAKVKHEGSPELVNAVQQGQVSVTRSSLRPIRL